MRPKTIRYTMALADDDGYLLAATGDLPWVTFLSKPSDGCSHQMSITSVDDLSGITFAILGIDADNKTVSENLVGPNAGKVYSVKYYKDLTSITASASCVGVTFSVGWLGGGKGEASYTPLYATAIYPHDGPLVSVDLISGDGVYTIQQTNDNVFTSNPVLWWTLGTADLDVDSEVQAKIGVSGLRVSVDAFTTMVFDVSFVQARR
jgi:hypothetical protein